MSAHTPVLVTKGASRAEVISQAGARGTGDEREGPSADRGWKGALSEQPSLAGGLVFPWAPQQDPNCKRRDVLGPFYRPPFYRPPFYTPSLTAGWPSYEVPDFRA